jgi:hypothetical protein
MTCHSPNGDTSAAPFETDAAGLMIDYIKPKPLFTEKLYRLLDGFLGAQLCLYHVQME